MPVNKHQTQLGRVRGASRRGERELNPPRETKTQARTGAGIGGHKCIYNNNKKVHARKIGAEGE